MSNTDVNLRLRPVGGNVRLIDVDVDGGTHIYAGSMCAQLASTGMLVPGSTASSGPCIGVSTHEQDNTNGADGAKRCRLASDGCFIMANDDGDPCDETTQLFSIIYMVDDHTVSVDDNSAARKPAGLFFGMEPDGKVRVLVGQRMLAQAEAALISIADGGNFTAKTTVEEALQELYQNALTAQKSIIIPLTAFREVDSAGAVGNITANGGILASDTTPVLGAETTTEQMAIIFAATIVDIIGVAISLPTDFDGTAPCTLDLIVKTDNSGGGGIEAATYTVLTTWDNNTQISDTATDSSPATTVHTVTATIAAADIPDVPTTLSLQLVHGTHANDPTHLLGVRLNYKPKLLTS